MNDIRQKTFNLVLRLIAGMKPTQEEARAIHDALRLSPPSAEESPCAEHPAAQDPDRLEVIRRLSLDEWQTSEAIKAIGMISNNTPDLMLASYFRHYRLFDRHHFNVRINLLGGLN